MNEKLPYEQLMAEKLAALPVPDMADAIWARIEAQLDLDMPADDGGGSNSPAPPTGGSNLLGHIGVFIGIVAIITILFINKNSKEKSLQPALNIPATEVTVTDSVPPDETPPLQNTLPSTTKENAVPAPFIAAPDSALSNPVVITTPDSVVGSNVPAPQVNAPAAIPVVRDTQPKRKRGVPLDDADYRIVPKKDSLP